MELNERDLLLIKEVGRWRFLLSRHILTLCGFSSQRTLNRRLKFLVERKYLERKKILYGVPYMYILAHKARVLIGYNRKAETIKTDRIHHDIMLLDSVAYIIQKFKIELSDITTEKEMLMQSGFGKARHTPDYSFIKNEKTYAVEIELTPKNKTAFEKNIRQNFMNYDTQLWIIEKDSKIHRMLKEFETTYHNIELLFLSDILDYIEKNK